jgi:hypothetical protein
MMPNAINFYVAKNMFAKKTPEGTSHPSMQTRKKFK